MSIWDRYQVIQALKREKVLCFDGINYANVVAVYLYTFDFFSLIKKIVFSLFFRVQVVCDDLQGANESTGVRYVVFYSGRGKRRKDYDYIPEKMRSVLSGGHRYVEVLERFYFFQVFCTLATFYSTWKRVGSIAIPFLDRLALALLVSKYRDASGVLARVVPFDSDAVLVTFCDAHPLENLITQLAHVGGAYAVTNQHGQYRVLDSSNVSQDAEAYANFLSDRLLCWGEATVQEFLRFGHSAERCFVTGWIKSSRLHPQDVNASADSVFGVMLNGENGKGSNPGLLDVANFLARTLGMRYLVRMHPANSVSDYLSIANENCLGFLKLSPVEYFSRVDFSVAHMTGGTVEALELNSGVYLIDDGKLADVFRVPGLSYESKESLLEAVKADRASPEAAIGRFERLRCFYNDDDDQDAKILSGICRRDLA